MHARFVFIAVALVGSTACGPPTPEPSPLIGTWRAVSANAVGTSFEFREDGSATWNLSQPFEIRFRADSAALTQLDLFDFSSGPLQGRTLFCLIDVTDRTLRMDCEPRERPTAFDEEQTQVFERVPADASRT